MTELQREVAHLRAKARIDQVTPGDLVRQLAATAGQARALGHQEAAEHIWRAIDEMENGENDL